MFQGCWYRNVLAAKAADKVGAHAAMGPTQSGHNPWELEIVSSDKILFVETGAYQTPWSMFQGCWYWNELVTKGQTKSEQTRPWGQLNRGIVHESLRSSARTNLLFVETGAYQTPWCRQSRSMFQGCWIGMTWLPRGGRSRSEHCHGADSVGTLYPWELEIVSSNKILFVETGGAHQTQWVRQSRSMFQGCSYRNDLALP
jgi:hypothetical protein